MSVHVSSGADPRQLDAMRGRIRCLMAIRGQTQSTLGKLMGLSQSTISLVLSGRRGFTATTEVGNFASALGVPASTIERGTPWPD